MKGDKYLPGISFGRVNTKTKEFFEGRTIVGEKAYETYHLNLLLNEILESRNYKQGNIPRIDRNNFIRILIEFSLLKQKKLSLCELGSSLMEILDGFDLVKKLYFPNLKKEEVPDFYGIEKSDFFNKVAKLIHPNHNFNIFSNLEEFENINLRKKSLSVLIDRAVSSYAFKNTEEFSNFIKRFDIAFLQIFGFKKSEMIIKDTIGTDLLYFNFENLNSKLKNFYHFYGFKRPTRPKELVSDENCIEGFFLYFATPEIYKEFKKIFLISNPYKEYFQEKAFFTNKLNDINICSFF